MSRGSLSQITVEALLYPYDFPNMLATVMGIEGGFLVRIGDAGIPANRLQLATPNGNLTDAAWEFDTNTWTFMTLTYDCATVPIPAPSTGTPQPVTSPTAPADSMWATPTTPTVTSTVRCRNSAYGTAA